MSKAQGTLSSKSPRGVKRSRHRTHLTKDWTVLAQRVGELAMTTIGCKRRQHKVI